MSSRSVLPSLRCRRSAPRKLTLASASLAVLLLGSHAQASTDADRSLVPSRDMLLSRVVQDRPAQTFFVDRALRILSDRAPLDDGAARRALDLVGQGKTSEALALLERAASSLESREKGRAAQLWWSAGLIAGSTSPDRSAADYRHALEVEPNDVAARYGLAIAETALDQAPQAMADFRQVLAQTKDEPTLFYGYWAQLRLADLRLLNEDRAGVEDTLRELRAEVEAHATTDEHLLAWQRDLASSLHILAASHHSHGERAAALAVHKAALAISRKLASFDPANRSWQRDLAVGENLVGDELIATGDPAAALAIKTEALAIFRTNVAADLYDVNARKDVAWCGESVADLLIAKSEYDEAGKLFEESIAIANWLGRVVKETDGQWHRDLARRESKLGNMLQDKKHDPPGALRWFDALRSLDAWLVRADPANKQNRRDLAAAYRKLAEAHLRHGEVEASQDAFRSSLQVTSKLIEEDPADVVAHADAASLYEFVGALNHAVHDETRALAAYAAELDERKIIAGARPADPDAQHEMALMLERMADSQNESGNTAGALKSYREAAAIYDTLLTTSKPRTVSRIRDLGVAFNEVGCAELKVGDTAAALADFRRRQELFDEAAAASPDDLERQGELFVSYMQLHEWLTKTGKQDEAASLLRAGRIRLADVARRHAELADLLVWFDNSLAAAAPQTSAQAK